MPDVLETKPADWKYVSEGGATIVYAYKGISHPDFDGTVLRLRKAPVAGVTIKPGTDTDSDDPTIEFQAKCMERLIPSEHLPRLESVWLSRSWLEALVGLQDHVRPESRRLKDQVDFTKGRGVLATDLVGGNWLAVEIKPKWGFLPSSTHLSDDTKVTKMQTCRFCLHSHLRARKGHKTVVVQTDYCPLDLFSGDEDRVGRAICSLWDAWIASDGTANNLKIFAAGKYIRPFEVEKFLTKGDDMEGKKIREIFAEALARPLLKTKVLRILSDLQRNLDVLDIEGLSKLWKEAELAAAPDADSITPFGGPSPHIQISDPDISDWTEFLDFYVSSRRERLDRGKPSVGDLRYYVLAYLLSATFKDCSIIVRLDFLGSGDGDHTLREIGPYSVVVIDLDPKSMNKLRGWEELDREIVTEYSPAQRKVCIDANQAK